MLPHREILTERTFRVYREFTLTDLTEPLHSSYLSSVPSARWNGRAGSERNSHAVPKLFTKRRHGKLLILNDLRNSGLLRGFVVNN